MQAHNVRAAPLALAMVAGSLTVGVWIPATKASRGGPAHGSSIAAIGPSNGANWQESVAHAIWESERAVSWQSHSTLERSTPAWQAPNRRNGLRVYFLPEGACFVPRFATTPGWRWGLSLVAFGWSDEVRPVPHAGTGGWRPSRLLPTRRARRVVRQRRARRRARLLGQSPPGQRPRPRRMHSGLPARHDGRPHRAALEPRHRPVDPGGERGVEVWRVGGVRRRREDPPVPARAWRSHDRPRGGRVGRAPSDHRGSPRRGSGMGDEMRAGRGLHGSCRRLRGRRQWRRLCRRRGRCAVL